MMRFPSALLWGVGALALLAGPAVLPTRADFDTTAPPGGPGPIPTISYTTFTGHTGFTAITSAETSPLNFPGSGNDGLLVSQVFTQTTAPGSLYAYVYQIQVSSSSGVQDVTPLSVNWKAAFAAFTGFGYPAGSTPGTDHVYEITSGIGSADPLFNSTSLVTATDAFGTDFKSATFDFPNHGAGVLGPGTNSDLLVLFSTIGPTFIPVKNIGSDIGSSNPQPSAFAPAPEPSAMALWSISGVGLAAGVFIRRFRVPPAKMA